MGIVAILAAGATAALVTHHTATRLAARAALRRPNYRGIEIPTGIGLAVILGTVAALAVLRVIPGSPGDIPAVEVAVIRITLIALLGFGLLGAWDDLTDRGHERGWRSHLSSIRRGEPTSGAIKLLAGGTIGFLVAPGGSVLRMLLAGAIVAGMANLVNLLDLRPGRAVKFSLVLALPIGIAAFVQVRELAPPVVALGAALAAFLPLDLRERAMLGDLGANAIGAMLGAAIVLGHGPITQLVVFGLLAILHLVGDRPGLSAIIARFPPAARLDALGRVPESVPAAGSEEPEVLD